jgi:hypothetical protein
MEMIDSFLKLFGLRHSESKHFTLVEQDVLLHLIDTRLSFGMDSFLQDIIFLVLHAPNPMSVIRRIMVKSLTQVKHPLLPPHQTVWLPSLLIPTTPTQSHSSYFSETLSIYSTPVV